MKVVIKSGNRAVVINKHNGCDGFWSFMVVNIRDGIDKADMTALRASHATEAGARRWAAKQLAA